MGPLELLARPARRWLTITYIVLAVTALAAGIAALLPNRYEVSASFVAEPTKSLSSSTLLQRIGLGDIGLGGSTPQFYGDLLRSRAVLRAVLHTQVPFDSTTRTVLDILGLSVSDTLRRLELGEQELSRRLTVRVDRITARVDISVWMPRAAAAQSVAEAFLTFLEQYNRSIRRSWAGEKRAFSEAQARMAAESLRSAERAMETFLESNRSFQQSAQLLFQHDRLSRAIAQRQDLYLTLARQAEEARIEEVDTRPVITVVDPPTLPARPAWPRRKLLTAAAAVVALIVTWSIFAIIELVRLAGAPASSDLGRALDILQEAFARRRTGAARTWGGR